MSKTVTLGRYERVVAVVPEHCTGPGWANSPAWIYIEGPTGSIRCVCLQPDEQPAELRLLFNIGALVVQQLVRSVPTMAVDMDGPPVRGQGDQQEGGEDMAKRIVGAHELIEGEMRRIEIRDREGNILVWACNAAGLGVFIRHPCEETYRQILGTAQAGPFSDKDAFRQFLSEHLGVRGRELGAWGWEEEAIC